MIINKCSKSKQVVGKCLAILTTPRTLWDSGCKISAPCTLADQETSPTKATQLQRMYFPQAEGHGHHTDLSSKASRYSNWATSGPHPFAWLPWRFSCKQELRFVLSFKLTLILTDWSHSRCWNWTKHIAKGIKIVSKNLADLEVLEESKDFQGQTSLPR